ncbi:MAG: hypothetical protein RQ847_12445 [Wenzhouxiangellaceae bacterium]|nr:hypothetical protein [Wenzhouxiangellaceae bacterium]
MPGEHAQIQSRSLPSARRARSRFNEPANRIEAERLLGKTFIELCKADREAVDQTSGRHVGNFSLLTGAHAVFYLSLQGAVCGPPGKATGTWPAARDGQQDRSLEAGDNEIQSFFLDFMARLYPVGCGDRGRSVRTIAQ